MWKEPPPPPDCLSHLEQLISHLRAFACAEYHSRVGHRNSNDSNKLLKVCIIDFMWWPDADLAAVCRP